MTAKRKTMMMAGTALVLVVLALATSPRQRTPDAFFDEGEEFFPDFIDPNAARTLEVIDYDAQTGTAIPFKVTFTDGRWTIPSHYNYDADGKDRLARTAAALIGLTKDDFRTSNPADYAACGVIDPLDESNPSPTGRGKRVTIKGENDVVLADIIVGKSFEGKEDFFLVRMPEQKRVYGTKMKLDISTSFKDWIESDLMMIEKDEIDGIILMDYSVDERTGRLNERDKVDLVRAGDAWTATGMKDGQEVDTYKLSNLVSALDELSIEGVRPKPAGLSSTLSRGGEASITQGDMLSLQEKGFYFTSDGRLVSNEGELRGHTSDGVTYTLRFGEIVFGSGLAVSAGTGLGDQEASGENRYLMITVSFDVSQFPMPEKAASLEFQSKPDSLWTEDDYRMRDVHAVWERWNKKVIEGRDRTHSLNARFAKWYYVISSENFDKLHLKRSDIIKEGT